MTERAHLPSETLCHIWPFCDLRHDGDYQNWWMNIDEHSAAWVNQIIRSSLTTIYHKWQPLWRHTKWPPDIHSNSDCLNLKVKWLSTSGQWKPLFSSRQHNSIIKWEMSNSVFDKIIWDFLSTDHLSNFISGPKTMEEGSMCCQGSAFNSTAAMWT